MMLHRSSAETSTAVRNHSPIGLLCYPGIDLDEISPAFETLAFRVRSNLEWIAADQGGVTLTDGTPLATSRSLGDGIAHLSLLVVPCGIVYSAMLARRDTLTTVLRSLRQAERVLLVARTAREARCAQLLLRPVSGWSSGAFWELFQPGRDLQDTLFVKDGHLCWAIGPSAAYEAAARLGSGLSDPCAPRRCA